MPYVKNPHHQSFTDWQSGQFALKETLISVAIAFGIVFRSVMIICWGEYLATIWPKSPMISLVYLQFLGSRWSGIAMARLTNGIG